MNPTYPFFVALIVINITYGAAQNSSEFNHFWLVQVWPHGYCLEKNCARRSSIFILHGLWPANSKGQTLEGTNESDPNKTEEKILTSLKADKSLTEDLEKYWLSLSTVNPKRLKLFWTYQWQKHGSAQKRLEPLDYFRRAVELTKYTDLLNTLAERGILANGTSYPKNKYKKAIEAKTGYTPTLSCVNKGGHYHLKEVTICVDAQAINFRPCKKQYTESCSASVKFTAPV